MKIQDLNLSSLKYFIDTVETGSFSKAASLNHVSRPAISQSILRLEEWAGVRLMNHQKKNLILTDDGIKFFRQAKQAYQNFEVDMKKSRAESDSLKVGCSASLAETYLIPCLKRFKDITNLEIFTGTSTQLIQKLKNKEINVALMIDNPKTTGISTKIIGSGKFHIFSKSGEMTNTLFVTEDRPEVVELKKWFLKEKKSPHYVKVESWTLARALAQAVGGACFIPEILAHSQFKKVELPGFKHTFHILLAHQRKELMSSAEDNFCSLVLDI